MLQWNGGPCFRLSVKWLNWCQSPRDKGLLLWNTATQALSSLKPGGTAGVCCWMRTKPWHNNTKWCLGWQKLICACSQKAMINDGEQGNAVPPFCSSLMGIEKQKKKKNVSPLFRKWRSSRVHYCYSSPVFPQERAERLGWIWEWFTNSVCGSYLCIIHTTVLIISTVIININNYVFFITGAGSFEVIIRPQTEWITDGVLCSYGILHTHIDCEPNVWTKWWCAVAMIMICICCVLGGDTWIFNCVCSRDPQTLLFISYFL